MFSCAQRWRRAEPLTLEVLARDPAAESVLPHHARDLAPHLVVALAGDHVLAAAVAPRKPDRGVALAAPAGPGSGDRAPCLPRPPPRSNGEGDRPSRGPDGGGCYARTSSSAGSTAFKRRRRHASCAFAGHCRCSGSWPRAGPAFPTLNW